MPWRSRAPCSPAMIGAAARLASWRRCGRSGCAAWSAAATATTSRISPGAGIPLAPEAEHRFWYQYYFHSERGRAGLTANRRALCRLLWRLWSPTWAFDDAMFASQCRRLRQPGFRGRGHPFATAIDSAALPGDPTLDAIEARLAVEPGIEVPSIVLQGGDDGVDPPESCRQRRSPFHRGLTKGG